MEIIIDVIHKEDNTAIAKVIRNVFEEFDAPRIGTVYSDATTDDLYSLFQQEGAKYWIAKVNGKVVGGCGIYPTEGLPDKYAELVKFYIAKEARGTGIGKLLMEKSMAAAITMGYTHLYIESLPIFDKAIHIYEKLGFVHINHSLGNSGHIGCNVWMLKDL